MRTRRQQEAVPLASEARHLLASAMQTSGVSKADVARRLGFSREAVAQVLNGFSADMTLGTLAKYAQALGLRVVVELVPERETR